MDAKIITQANKQQTQRAEAIKAPVLNPTEYYKGADIKIPVMDLLGEEIPLEDYINEDPDNIAFIINNIHGPPIAFATSREHTNKQLGSYECTYVDSARSFTGNRYIMLSRLGCPCTGVASYHPLKYLLDVGVQVFILRETEYKTGTLMSHTVRYMGERVVSNAHCQAGSEQMYYQLFIPEPLIQPLRNWFTSQDHIEYKSSQKPGP